MRKFVAALILGSAIVINTNAASAFAGDIGPSRATMARDAYYDGHYGPFYDGYWSADGSYFYSTGPGRPYARDDGSHFRRAMAGGFIPVEGSAPSLRTLSAAR